MADILSEEKETIKKETEKVVVASKVANVGSLTENEKSFLSVLLMIILVALIFSTAHYLPPVEIKTAPARSVGSRQLRGQPMQPRQLPNRPLSSVSYPRQLDEQQYPFRQRQQQFIKQMPIAKNFAPANSFFKPAGPSLRQRYQEDMKGALDSSCYSRCLNQFGEESILYCQNSCRY